MHCDLHSDDCTLSSVLFDIFLLEQQMTNANVGKTSTIADSAVGNTVNQRKQNSLKSTSLNACFFLLKLLINCSILPQTDMDPDTLLSSLFLIACTSCIGMTSSLDGNKLFISCCLSIQLINVVHLQGFKHSGSAKMEKHFTFFDKLTSLDSQMLQ